MILFFIIGLVIYCVCPLPVQLVAFMINFFLPDSVPFVDEFIMACSSIKKVYDTQNAISFFEEHPVLGKCLIVVGIVGLIIWAFIFIKTGIEVMFL